MCDVYVSILMLCVSVFDDTIRFTATEDALVFVMLIISSEVSHFLRSVHFMGTCAQIVFQEATVSDANIIRQPSLNNSRHTIQHFVI